MNDNRLLSPFISRLISSSDDATYKAFCASFLDAQVGVFATGIGADEVGVVVTSAARPLTVGLTSHADGRDRILAFADPAEFEIRYGRKFNALMLGRELGKTALLNPACAGILVNSAMSTHSIAIDRETLTRFAGSPVSTPMPTPARRAWWKFW